MTKRIFGSIMLTAVIVLLATFAVILDVLYVHYSAEQKKQLETELSFAAAGTENNGIDYLKAVEKSGSRLTLIDPDGNVLFDSAADADEMENHSEREEFIQALKNGKGESERYSATLMTGAPAAEITAYLAQRLNNGSVLRVSATRLSVMSLVIGMLQPVIVIIVLAIIISAVLAHKISRKIVEPLNKLNLDAPLENNTYEELSPLLTRMEQQYRRIDEQKKSLGRMQREFRSITENMTEGLVLLSDAGNPGGKSKILSINKAAAQLFETDESCIGTDFIMTDRSLEISEAIKAAFENGKAELIISRNGRDYQLNISRIEKSGSRTGTPAAADSGDFYGIVMLSFDVTEKLRAEQNRREFTANVSHELKTPLTSIMGAAELMENGLVKEEDVPDFSHRIYAESKRLLTLINDIISLSQLDEKMLPAGESCDIYNTASLVIQSLQSAAEEKNVTITLSGVPTAVKGSEKLIYDIVQNLCSNAVKYNVNKGKVTVEIEETGDKVRFTVSDTGIGIPPEHQQRVFERFYRVEKSRSKESGGTGLGLSIVKHAVELLGGEISLESKIGKGTRIDVMLPPDFCK